MFYMEYNLLRQESTFYAPRVVIVDDQHEIQFCVTTLQKHNYTEENLYI